MWLMLLYGMGAVGRWNITYIYLLEFWTTNKVKAFGCFINSTAAISLIYGSLCVQFITPGNTQAMEYTALVLTVIPLILAPFCIPESPKYLMANGQVEKA
jgi:hypothetical protein